jgi:hypothetical protein
MSNKEKDAVEKFFVYDPEGDGFICFATEEERDICAKDLIPEYLGDGWDEGVENIKTGIITSTVKQTNVIHKKDLIIDSEGFDEEGRYWSYEWDYICDYELVNLAD